MITLFSAQNCYSYHCTKISKIRPRLIRPKTNIFQLSYYYTWGLSTKSTYKSSVSPHNYSGLLKITITPTTFLPSLLHKSEEVQWAHTGAQRRLPLVTLDACNVSACVCVSTYLKAWYKCPPHLWSQHSRPFLQCHSIEEREKKGPVNKIKSQLKTHKRQMKEKELTTSSRLKLCFDITSWAPWTAFRVLKG